MRKQGRDVHRSTQMSRNEKERKRQRQEADDAAALATLQQDLRAPRLLLTNGSAPGRGLLMGAADASSEGAAGDAEMPPAKRARAPGSSQPRSEPQVPEVRWLRGFARDGQLSDRQMAALHPDYICVGRFPDNLTLSKFFDSRTLRTLSQTRLHAADLLRAGAVAQVIAARESAGTAAAAGADRGKPAEEGPDAAALRLSLSPGFWRAVFPHCAAWEPGPPLLAREAAALLSELSVPLPARAGAGPVVFDLLTASREGCTHVVDQWTATSAAEPVREPAQAFACDTLPFIPLAFCRGAAEDKDGAGRVPALLGAGRGGGRAEVLRGTFVEVDVEAVLAAATESGAGSRGAAPAAEPRIATVEEMGAEGGGPACEQAAGAPGAAHSPPAEAGARTEAPATAPPAGDTPLAAAANVVAVDEDAARFQNAVALLEAARAHHVLPGPAARDALARGVRVADLVLVDGGAELGPESPSIAFTRPEHFGRFRLLAAALVAVTTLGENGVAVVRMTDTVTRIAAGVLHLLALSFDSVALHRPSGAFGAAAHTYAVALGFNPAAGASVRVQLATAFARSIALARTRSPDTHDLDVLQVLDMRATLASDVWEYLVKHNEKVAAEAVDAVTVAQRELARSVAGEQQQQGHEKGHEQQHQSSSST